jgi:hypothetical protein
MRIEKSEVEKTYLNNQPSMERLPKAAEIAHTWRKESITMEELRKINPQIYIGFKVNDRDNIRVGDSGYFTYETWLYQAGRRSSRIERMYDSFKRLNSTDRRVYSSIAQMDANRIGEDLARVALEYPEEKPLIMLNSYGMLPYTTGNTIDGVRRIFSLFDQYDKHNIQGSAELNVLVGDFSKVSCFLYNTAAFITDDKPMPERIELATERFLEEDIVFSDDID